MEDSCDVREACYINSEFTMYITYMFCWGGGGGNLEG